MFFEVKPGESFHAIQEILGEKPRISISGWFHFTDSNMLTKYASREQLSNKTDKSVNLKIEYRDQFMTFLTNMSSAQRIYYFFLDGLVQSILQKQIFRLFERSFHPINVCNFDFLKPQISENINALLFGKRRTDKNTGRHKKMSRNWKVNGPPHKHRYLKLETRGKYFLNDVEVCSTFLIFRSRCSSQLPIIAGYLLSQVKQLLSPNLSSEILDEVKTIQ